MVIFQLHILCLLFIYLFIHLLHLFFCVCVSISVFLFGFCVPSMDKLQASLSHVSALCISFTLLVFLECSSNTQDFQLLIFSACFLSGFLGLE